MMIKAGDTVEILDGRYVRDYAGSWVPSMTPFIGKTAKVTKVNGTTAHLEGGGGYVYDTRYLKLINRVEEIKSVSYPNLVIWTDGNAVFAKNPNTGKIGTAYCSPDDKFDYSEGAKIAIKRCLYEKDSRYLNCTFMPLQSGWNLTKGKIYKVVDGRFTDDAGCKFPYAKMVTKDDLVAYLGVGKFSNDGIGIGKYCTKVIDVIFDPDPTKQYLNCEFVVADTTNSHNFTIGKIYEVINGYFKTDSDFDGEFPIGKPIETREELINYLSNNGCDRRFGGNTEIVILKE